MQLGPVHISFDSPAGVWLTKPGGTPQNITVPVVVGTVLALFVFCCCARAIF